MVWINPFTVCSTEDWVFIIPIQEFQYAFYGLQIKLAIY